MDGNDEAEALALVLMGVSGAGKTTVGRLLATDLGWVFLDADDLHPESNRRKMSAGLALDDADRWPWLRRVRRQIEDHLQRGVSSVVACSALKAAYREILTQDLEGVRIVYLRGDPELISARLEARQGHFMPPDLLASQFAALEEPGDTWVVDVAEAPGAIASRIRSRVMHSIAE